MKQIFTVPVIFLATASFVSFSIVLGPVIKRIKRQQKDRLKKYQQSYYISRR